MDHLVKNPTQKELYYKNFYSISKNNQKNKNKIIT